MAILPWLQRAGFLWGRIRDAAPPPQDRAPARPGLDLAQLEDRILLSAAPLPGLTPDGALGDSAGPSDFMTAPLEQVAVAEEAGAEEVTPLAAASMQAGGEARASEQIEQRIRLELVFLDPRAEGYEQLLEDLRTGGDSQRALEVYLLDPTRDGVEQISQALAGRADVDALHLISHGTEGKFSLGNTWLGLETVNGYAGRIAAWSHALRDGADLLIYGCDLAGDADGRALTEALAVLTGADVAASIDATGHADLGGDWDLEHRTGAIESSLAVSDDVQQDWRHLLPNSPPTITSSATPVVRENVTVVQTLTATDSDGDTVTFSISGGADAALFTIDTSGQLVFLTAPNFEAPTDANADNVYAVDILADDGAGGQTPQSVLVTVTNAVEIVVDTAADNVDGNTSSISALLANKGADGKISLREAILAANNTANVGGPDTIQFNISGASTINLGSALPTITDAVIIDGASDPDYAGTPVIELNGAGAGGSADGLTITAGNSTIRGLAINRFGEYGLVISGGGGNVIQGNFIGTNTAGTAARPNGYVGIEINNSANNVIGGTTVAERNIISGNASDGIDIVGAGSTGNIVQGNYIGLDVTGTTALGNFNGVWIANGAKNNIIGGTAPGAGNVVSGNIDDGVEIEGSTSSGNVVQGNYIGTDATGAVAIGNDTGVLIQNAPNNVIGGTTAAARNLISGNLNMGVILFGSSATGNQVQGNAIGTDAAGDADLGNAGHGVYLTNSADGAGSLGYAASNTIGGATLSSGNIIAYNDGVGVALEGGTKNTIRANSIHSNGSLGIDLGVNGVTNNDLTDLDGGANAGQNFPVLTSAVISGGTIDIDGSLTSDLFNATYTLDFYASPTGDGSNHGEGKIYLGSSIVTTNLLGAVSFSATGSSLNIGAGYKITATATDPTGNTSEFSQNVTSTGNTAPTIASNGGGASASVSVAENTTAVTTVTATDPDLPSNLTYSISGGADAAKFTINAATGALAFVAAPNFEAPTDGSGDNVYLVTVRVSDGNGGTDTQALSVTVVDVNESPAITSSSSLSINENQSVVHTLTVADPDLPAQTINFAIIGGADAAKFTINGANQLVFLTVPDFEAPTDANADNVYVVDVQASDGAGGVATQTVSVAVTAVNDTNPVFISLSAASINENETLAHVLTAADADSPSQLVTFAIVGGADAAKFLINGANQLVFLAAPDYEAPTDANADNVYVVDVQASDGAGGLTTQTISVTVDPVNEHNPAFTSSNTAAVDENQTIVHTLNATDDDLPGQTITFSIVGGADAARFTIDGSNRLVFATAPDYEAPADADTNNVYVVTVQASDGAGGTATQTINVTVNPVDEGPVFISPSVIFVNEGTGAVIVTFVAIDPESPGSTVTYAITGGADAARFWINGGDKLKFVVSPDFESPTDEDTNNVYEVIVTATDAGGVSTVQTIIVNVTPNNEAPTVTPATWSTAENTGNGTVLGVVSASDPDPGDSVTYSITAGNTGGAFAINTTTGQVTVANSAALDYETTTAFNLTVQVRDEGGLTATAAVTVNLTAVNDNNPVFTSSAAPSVNENQTVVHTLAATDADLPGQTITFSIVGGADAAKFTINGSNQLVFNTAPDRETPTDANSDNVYVVDVRASDGAGGLTTQTINVTVTSVNEHNPVFTSPAAVSVNENQTVVQTLTATDADLPGQTLTFSIVGGVDAARFMITGGNQLVFTAAPDYEAPADSNGNNIYVVNVRASDGAGGVTTQTITVTVTPVNEHGPVFTSTSTPTMEENNSIVHTLTAVDPDTPSQSISFAITGGADAALFTIDGSDRLRFLSSPNFEAPGDTDGDNVYEVEVTATDAGGVATVQNVQVIVTNVNGPPTVASATFQLAENTANGTSVGVVGVSDPDADVHTFSITGGNIGGAFAINSSTGEITVANSAALDYEARTSFSLTVRAQDQGGLSDMATITVNLTPVNESGPVFVSSSTPTMAENNTIVITLAAFDPDAPDLAIGFTITGGADAALFTIDGSNRLRFVAAPNYEAPLDADGDNVYDVQVTAQEAGGLATTQSLQVRVTNQNGPPTVWPATFSVAENTANGTSVGVVAVSDPDIETHTFSIVAGNGSGAFAINSATGEITVAKSTALDYEATTSFSITVRAQDEAGRSDTEVITINLTPVNEHNPVFTSSSGASVSENQMLAKTLTATDADLPGQFITFSIVGGADAARFTITGGNRLEFLAGPDFESPADADADNVYVVDVQASDGEGRVTTQTISIAVSPVNEHDPVFTSNTSAAIDENQTIVHTLTATDADLAGQSLTFAIAGGADGARFTIDGANRLVFQTAPDFESPADANTDNVYEVDLRVSDGAGRTTVQSVTVTVNPVNDNNPYFTSSMAPSITEGETVVATLTADDDDLPGQTVTLTIVGGADAAHFIFDGANQLAFLVAPDYDAPADADGDNVYEVLVNAADGAGGTTTELILVSVNSLGNQNPVFTSAAVVSISENQTVVQTLSASDPDVPAQAITFAIIGGPDAARFSINGTHELVFLAAPDFEAPSDSNANNVYLVRVQASDGDGGVAEQLIRVTVDPVNEHNPVLTSGAAVTVNEGDTLVHTLAATDADLPGATLTFSIVGGADAAHFTVNGAQELVFLTAPDFESPNDADGDNVYHVAIQVDDGQGGMTVRTIAVTVAARNDQSPIFTSGDSPSVAENQTFVQTLSATDADLPGQTVTFSIVGGADAAQFTLTAGQLAFVSALDFESPADADADNVYEVQVEANDGAGGTTVQTIRVTVVNANEPPAVVAAVLTVTENAMTGTQVGIVAATVADAGDTITFAIVGGDPDGMFVIDATTGEITVAAGAALDFETTPMFSLTVEAQDAGGLAHSAVVTVHVDDLNEAPTANDDAYATDDEEVLTVSAAEGVLANDADPDDNTLTVTLVSGPSHGTLILNPDGSFVYTPHADIFGTDSFVYQATDTGGLSQTATVVITVEAVVEEEPVEPEEEGGPVFEPPEPAESPAPEAPPTVEPPKDKSQPEPPEPVEDAVPDEALAPETEAPTGQPTVMLAAAVPAEVEEPTATIETLVFHDDAPASDRTAGTQTRGAAAEQESIARGAGDAYAPEYDAALLAQDLNDLENEMQDEGETPVMTAGWTTGFSSALSVGYVLWTIRGGWLATSLLAQMPAWRLMDPLVVLDYLDEESPDGDDDDSLESMLESNQPPAPDHDEPAPVASPES